MTRPTTPKVELDSSLKLLKAEDVATLLGISMRSLWRFRSTGVIPAPIRIGERTLRWRAQDIQEYLDRQSRMGGGR